MDVFVIKYNSTANWKVYETHCFLFINICFFYLNSHYLFFLISVIHLDDENKNHLLYITHSV